MNLTSQNVIDFWKYMNSFYKTSTVDKNNSTMMSTIGTFLNTMGVLNKTSFMNKFTTTIGTTIYTPFTIGDTNNKNWSLLDQIIVCVHEHMHVLQYKKDGSFTFPYKYLATTKGRTEYEAEAYTCSLEMFWLVYQAMPSTDIYVNSMKSYNVTPQDLITFKNILDANALLIKAGKKIMEEPVQTATNWLNINIINKLI